MWCVLMVQATHLLVTLLLLLVGATRGEPMALHIVLGIFIILIVVGFVATRILHMHAKL